MSHKPPKDDVERLENLLEGLMDYDESELPPLEESNARAKAAGIDFAAWGEQIRAMARKQLVKEQTDRIAEALTARDKALERIEARPRPTGTREEKVAMLRSLMKQAGGEALAAHFKNFEEASESAIDEMILAAQDLLDREKKGDG